MVWPNGVLASTAVGLAVQLVTPWFSEHPGFTYLEYDGDKGTVTKSIHMQALHNRRCAHHPVEETGDPLFDVRDSIRHVAQRKAVGSAAAQALAPQLLWPKVLWRRLFR